MAKDAAAAQSGGVGVELDHDTEVLEGVLLAAVGLAGLLGRVDGGLDSVGVDDSRKITVGHDVAGQVEAGLVLVDGVEGFEGALGEDDEATHVASRGELEEVEARHVLELHTREVAEGAGDAVVFVVDNKRTAALGEAAVAHLAAAGAGGAGVADVFDVLVSADGSAQGVGGGGLGDALDGVGDDQGDLGDAGHAVTTGQDEGGDSGSSKSRSNGVAALVLVDLLVPLAPGLGGSEHASTTAHVTEGTLTRAGGTATSHTGDTGHGATGTPGFGGGLVTGVAVDGVGLAGVLRHLGVHEVHDVRADGGGEDSRESNGVGGTGDRDGGASGECHGARRQ